MYVDIVISNIFNLNKKNFFYFSFSFVLLVSEYFFAVWCSAAGTHLTLFDRVICGALFLTWSV